MYNNIIQRVIGTIFESFWKYLNSIPGKQEIKELQKAAILGTALVTSGSANVK
jgi:hypothetical protein